ATAEVLKAGSGPGRGAKVLALAGLIGAATKLVETGFRLWAGTAQAATYVGSSTIAYVGMNLSPALISVGYIVGLNIAVLVFLGGAISWYVAIPIYSTWLLDGDAALAGQFAEGLAAEDLAFAIWTTQIRYLGVGAMLVGGIWALISMRGSLASGIVSGLRADRSQAAAVYDHTQHDTPMRLVLVGIGAFVIPIFVIYETIVGSIGIALAMTVVMVVAGFLFSSVAAYMAGLVGSSNNPISGITIATILLTSLLLLWLLGSGAANGPAAAIMVGAVVCCAAAIAGDNLQDLKAGYIVGATPWKQQVMQGVGTISAVLVIAPILNLLLQAYGIGVRTPEQPNALLAPQATLMASVAQGVFGAGLPWGMVAAGAGIGVVIVAADEYLKARRSSWRAPVLAVAVGIYLPLELAVAILLGGLIAHAASRSAAAAGAGESLAQRNGMLFAAGLITGEALIGIFMAIPIVLSGDPNVIAIDANLPSFFGLIVIAVISVMLYRVATRRISGGTAG
ncbi:MAG TPA: oligopeptide transporter, OPT family, partial [Gammaproteobacteria bacterium]|nr:oligopeptide transporter, OPT family [Gammaproteobacteria bacterium]